MENTVETLCFSTAILTGMSLERPFHFVRHVENVAADVFLSRTIHKHVYFSETFKQN